MTELKVKIANFDRPNKNGQIYTKECLEALYNNYKGLTIPMDLVTPEGRRFRAGTAQITSLNYPELLFEAKADTTLSGLIKSNIGGCGLNFRINSEDIIEDENGIKTIKNIKHLTSLGYTLYPAYESSIEIKENCDEK